MKIITEGKGWTKRLTCRGCKSVLEIEESDLSRKLTEVDISAQQYQEEIEARYFVSCPKCTIELEVKAKDIPAAFRGI